MSNIEHAILRPVVHLDGNDTDMAVDMGMDSALGDPLPTTVAPFISPVLTTAQGSEFVGFGVTITGGPPGTKVKFGFTFKTSATAALSIVPPYLTVELADVSFFLPNVYQNVGPSFGIYVAPSSDGQLTSLQVSVKGYRVAPPPFVYPLRQAMQHTALLPAHRALIEPSITDHVGVLGAKKTVFNETITAARINQLEADFSKPLTNNRVLSTVSGGATVVSESTTESTVEDSGPFGNTGTLVGTVLPNLVASPWAGFVNALNFDGVDRDDLSSGVNLGTSQDFALRGQTGRSYEAALRALGPASLWRMNEVAGDMIDQMPAQPYAPKVTQHTATDRGTYSAAVLALSGLQSYWKLGEAAGNVLDSGPAAVPGVVAGSVTREAAALINPSRAAGNKALRLTTGTVNFGATAHRLAGTQAFWIRRIVQLAVGSTASNFTCATGSAPVDAFGWAITTGNATGGVRQVIAQRGSGAVVVAVSATFPDDGLPHVVDWLYNGLVQSLLIDGAIAAQIADATSLVASTADLVLTGADAVQDDAFISYIAVIPSEATTLYLTATTERYSGGLSSYWRLGEAAGDFADSGPAGLPGVGTGLTRAVASVVTPAQTGGDLAVAGLGSVDFGQGYKFLGREAYSLELWCTAPTRANNAVVVGTIDSGGSYAIRLLDVSGVAAITFVRRIPAGFLNVTVNFDYTLPQNQRLHLVATYDGTTMILYAQGVEIGRTAAAETIQVSPHSLILSLDPPSKADDIAIYPSFVMSPAQVQQHFTYGSSKIGACNGVVSGSVTRNVASLVTANQNNPFGDVNGALRLTGGDVNDGSEAYRLGGRQAFSIRRIVQLAVGSGDSRLDCSAGAVPTISGWTFSVGVPVGGQRLVFGARGAGATTIVSTTVPDDGLRRIIDWNYDGSTQRLYVDGALAATVADTTNLALSTSLLVIVGANAVQDDLAIYLRALTAAEVLSLHTESTVWDGKRPKTFDVRVRPDVLQDSRVLARATIEGSGSHDFAVGVSTAPVDYFAQYVRADGAIELLRGGTQVALTNRMLRLVDDRTAVRLFVEGLEVASSFQRPIQSTIVVDTFVGRAVFSAQFSFSPQPFDGIIDELRVSNSVRSDAGAAPYTSDANTLALYHFDAITAATGPTGFASLCLPAAATAAASLESIRSIEYQPYRAIFAAFTSLLTAVPVSPLTAVRYGFRNTLNGGNGVWLEQRGDRLRLGIKRGGVTRFVERTEWDDPMTGGAVSRYTRDGVPETFSILKMQINQFEFGWLGTSVFEFFVQAPDGHDVFFHKLRLPNDQTKPTFSDPNMKLFFEVEKVGADAQTLCLKTASWAAGVIIDPYGTAPSSVKGREEIDICITVAGSAVPISTTVFTAIPGREAAILGVQIGASTTLTGGGLLTLTDGLGGTVKHAAVLNPASGAVASAATNVPYNCDEPTRFSNSIVFNIPAIGVGSSAYVRVAGYNKRNTN